MIAKYQKEQTVSRLKKTYSALQQAANRAIADYGPIYSWEYSNGYDGAVGVALKYFYPYLKVAKKCRCDGDKSCIFEYKALNNSEIFSANSCVSTRFYLDDGTFVYISSISGNYDGSVPLVVTVDLNGQNKPNVLGKDVFQFTYYLRDSNATKKYSNKVNPYIWQTSGTYCTSQSQGKACTLKIFEDGFTIKDDYPW